MLFYLKFKIFRGRITISEHEDSENYPMIFQHEIGHERGQHLLLLRVVGLLVITSSLSASCLIRGVEDFLYAWTYFGMSSISSAYLIKYYEYIADDEISSKHLPLAIKYFEAIAEEEKESARLTSKFTSLFSLRPSSKNRVRRFKARAL